MNQHYLARSAAIVTAAAFLDDVDRLDLAAWEHDGRATSEWPGWDAYLPAPFQSSEVRL